MTSGIDTSAFHPTLRPADDLFRHVNGPWIESTDIRPDRATAGAFVTLVDEAEETVKAIIEDAAADQQASGERRQIADLYTSFMDTERIEALGATPLDGELDRIAVIDSIASLTTTLGQADAEGWARLVGLFIAPDEGQPDRYTAYAMQGGLGLPDESYYREDNFAEAREAYLAHLERIFALAGLDSPADRARRMLDLETNIAEHHWNRVDSRDAQKTYNPTDAAGLQALAPTFDWQAWREAAGYPEALLDHLIVAQPSFLEGVDSLLTEENIPAWRDWMYRQAITSAAPYLSEAFVEANFDFYGRTLSGTDELRARWKRGVSFVEGAVGEAVGKLYVAENYPDAARVRMDELIGHLIEAYRESITGLPWMSEETKKRALEKLDSFTPKVGHPLEWKDYGGLKTDPADLVGNARRAHTDAVQRELAKLGAPVDANEWYMTPQTVNAYYNPTMNEIVFPAAILQPPFFHPDADDAVNFGAIGAVIGHEIGHGFDDQGSQYDGTGALRNWWTDADRADFEELTGALIAQYDDLSPEGSGGKTVNGAFTIGENIGDLGGLGIAYRALRRAIGDDEPAPIDGLAADQRFFVSWAQAWQAKVRPAEVVRRLTIDPHSPPEFRCNQVVSNIDAFHEAFDVDAGDDMWLDPARRVTIW